MVTKLYSGTTEVPIPEPDEGFDRPIVQVGASVRTLDGTLRQHISAQKRRWTLTWSHLDSTDFSNLLTQLRLTGSLTFYPPDDTTAYTVMVVGDIGTKATQFGRTVTATLEQV